MAFVDPTSRKRSPTPRAKLSNNLQPRNLAWLWGSFATHDSFEDHSFRFFRFLVQIFHEATIPFQGLKSSTPPSHCMNTEHSRLESAQVLIQVLKRFIHRDKPRSISKVLTPHQPQKTPPNLGNGSKQPIRLALELFAKSLA